MPNAETVIPGGLCVLQGRLGVAPSLPQPLPMPLSDSSPLIYATPAPAFLVRLVRCGLGAAAALWSQP
jgi:hypothetical protein